MYRIAAGRLRRSRRTAAKMLVCLSGPLICQIADCSPSPSEVYERLDPRLNLKYWLRHFDQSYRNFTLAAKSKNWLDFWPQFSFESPAFPNGAKYMKSETYSEFIDFKIIFLIFCWLKTTTSEWLCFHLLRSKLNKSYVGSLLSNLQKMKHTYDRKFITLHVCQKRIKVEQGLTIFCRNKTAQFFCPTYGSFHSCIVARRCHRSFLISFVQLPPSGPENTWNWEDSNPRPPSSPPRGFATVSATVRW